MDQVIGMLKQYQANSVVFSSTAHGFHWNVEGPLFTQYHGLFGSIYEDVDGTVDTIAEWIRVFDVQSPYTLQQLIDLQNFGDVLTSSNSPIVMSRMLLSMNDKMINDIKMMFDIATEAKEQGLANFLADRQTAHEKWGWFLKASIKQTIN
jgi:starvation-inducible DNA-binding protein